MENMRRILLQPPAKGTLRMANGGNFFTRLVGGSTTGKTLAGRGAAIDAATNAAVAAPVVEAPPAKPERTVADIRFKDGGSLRTGMGGHVPGKGQGDKVDALYEPGEFVVSNDMLDADPELRDELSSLRGRVLATKGMTQDEADAKAVGRGSLRAANGFEEEDPRRMIAAPATQGATNAAPQNDLPGNATQRQGGASSDWSDPAGAGSVGASPSLRESVGGMFPGSRAVGAGFSDDISSALREPTFAGKVGKAANATGRAVLAAPLGLAEDVLEPWTRATAPALSTALDIGKTAFTGESPGVAAAPAPTPREPSPSAAAAQPAASGLPDGTRKLRDGIYETRRPGQSVEFGDEASLTDVGFRNRGAISAQNMGAADALDSRYASERQGLRQREQYNAEVANARAVNAGTRAQIERYNQKQETDKLKPKERQAVRELQAREASSLRDSETTRRGQDLSFASAARGQDITARGQDITQANADRTYKMDVRKFGVETANKNRDDKRAGDEAFSKRIAGMVGNDPDGVAAARIVNGANLFIGDGIRAAQEELKKNPGNAKAARDLARFEGGVGALDDKIISQLVLGQQAAQAMQENAGLMPWEGSAKNSAAPVTSLRLKEGLLFDDYVSDDASGNQVLPARALRDNPDLSRLITK